MSTVPTVKAALVSLLTSALPSAQVIYGPRGSVTITKPNIIEVGGAVGTVDAASLNLREHEDYVIEVIVSVTIPGPDAQRQATETANVLWAAAKAAVRNPPGGTLGVTGVSSVQAIGEFELTETSNSDGRNAAIRSGIRVQAQ